MCFHDTEVMGFKPGQVELGVGSLFLSKSDLNQIYLIEMFTFTEFLSYLSWKFVSGMAWHPSMQCIRNGLGLR